MLAAFALFVKVIVRENPANLAVTVPVVPPPSAARIGKPNKVAFVKACAPAGRNPKTLSIEKSTGNSANTGLSVVEVVVKVVVEDVVEVVVSVVVEVVVNVVVKVDVTVEKTEKDKTGSALTTSPPKLTQKPILGAFIVVIFVCIRALASKY